MILIGYPINSFLRWMNLWQSSGKYLHNRVNCLQFPINHSYQE